MHLTDIWFLLIAVLWTGYFFLEGFDFGVGILGRFLAANDAERRVAINTIGPVWDGNEVWLLVAGGATFAAFPHWYATLFSGFYLPLLIILIALIVRGLAFEYRGKIDSPTWQRRWDAALFWGSLVPAVLWGVAFANIVRGVPIDARREYVGGLLDLLNPYALLGGLATLALFTFHGALFLALKTKGELRHRANRAARSTGIATIVLGGVFLGWTVLAYGTMPAGVAAIVAAAGLAAALIASGRGREGWAFALSGTAVVAVTATLFMSLYPDVMPSSINPAYSLTVTNAASTPYTLKVMTWVAVIFTPFVLAYQSWTYWVFRRRISVADIPAPASPPAERAPAVTGKLAATEK
ncbi:cytochrome d ubiquinol oxidase subunit II [Carbonactinospora thermoautotrophica]|uniref:cytochrome d ubiquinol oxidase subunit II n=1 Tax=Carbonactinospora thermoautotrophica TaxID=1469144 RepID=UPI00226F2E8F|nr:cytochrome d ubiquinol oxidase subunit II [Carbonactinospora thermoautotrophica]MCX9190042.1 cytochrome d ubiquinol oxidase subunit II [Carbonactinospora thermoautotrophica]